MGKTSTKRFFPALLLMLIGCLWGNSAWAEKVTYTVSSTSAVTTSGTAPSGSSATFTNSNSTKEQLTAYTKMTLTLSGFSGMKITGITLSMKSNTSKGAGYLDVKAGTTQLAAIGSSSSGVAFKNAAWHGSYSQSYVDVNVSLTNTSYVIQDGENVVVVIGATVNSLYCQSFTLTYEEAPSTPTITTSESSLSFGDVETGTSQPLSFTLSGCNLTADATLSISGTHATYFSVNPGSISQTDGTIAATDVTVTYAPTAQGAHTATLTIASGETTKEIALSGTGIAPLAHYTVNWMVNGTAYTEGAPTTDVKEGEKVTTLPTTPPAIGDKVFMGWTNEAIISTLDSAPEVLFSTAADAPNIAGNVTFYAVYATKDGEIVWKEITALPEAGTYAILSSSNFMKASIASDRFENGNATPKISSTSPATLTIEPAEDCIWEITKPDDYYRIASGSKYAGGNSAKNQGALLDDASNNYAKWTIEYSSGFAITNYGRSIASSSPNNKFLRNNTTYGWACYSSSTGSAPRLFKKYDSITYSDYVTTVAGNVLEERNLSFGETTAFDVYGSSSSFVAPALTGVTSGVTYTSSNEAVAKVDAEKGTVTLQGAVGTTTIKAAADKDENYMADEATYTLSVWPTSIAGIKLLINSTTATDFKAELTNATVTYVNGNNVYLQDDNAAILMYLSNGHGLTAGKSYTGRVTGRGNLYSGLREITKIDLSGTTSTDNTKEPKIVTLAQLNADFDAYESMYVKVVGVTTGTLATSGSYKTATLTQGTNELQLRAPSTISLIANNEYDFVGFPGSYSTTKQLNVWEESQITNQGKQDPNLAFAQTSYTVEVNKTVTVAAKNVSGTAIVYSVDDSNCSINTTTGDFTATATGTYTVTATCVANESYIAGTATCQVVVTPPVTNLKPTVLYKQITSKEELVDGGVYIVGCAKIGDAMGAINAANKRMNSSNTINIKTDKNFNYYDGQVNADGLPYEITITQAEDGTYNLYHAEGQYINGTSDADLSFTATSAAGWSIAFTNEGNVMISHKSKTGSYIQRNGTDTYKYYKNYASNTCAVQLYQKVNEMNIHAKVKGYTTFVTDDAYVMPAGLTGKTVNVVANGALKIDDAFQAGDAVPALTPLLIRTSEAYAADETMKSYYPAVTTKKVTVTDENVTTLLANNDLEYYRTNEDMTSSKKLVTPYYYKLSVDTEGNNPGFYWGAEGGAAFKMKNGSTAYLACSVANEAAAAYFIDEYGEVTAIEGAPVAGQLTEDAVIYNLQGVRMNTKNLQRGIYIINGRKTVVK